MAEQEIAKHTKKTIEVITDKRTSVIEKLKDFLLEIAIIVFAVTISIWFHNWSEYRTEQKKVKVFLLGLKQDINEDIDETNGILNVYKEYTTCYTFLSKLKPNVTPNKDSLKRYIGFLNNNIYFRTHKSRFDGFLATGKMLDIESDSLVSKILLYYQESLLEVRSSESGWIANQDLLTRYMFDNMDKLSNDEGYWKVLATPKGNYLCSHLIPWQQLIERHQNFITLGKQIVKLIDEEYHLK
jgi:hypothetical protein